MAGTGLYRLLHLFGILEIIATYRFHICIQLIHQRDTGRNVHLDNIGIRHAIQILDQRTQAVAMCHTINTRFPERTAGMM